MADPARLLLVEGPSDKRVIRNLRKRFRGGQSIPEFQIKATGDIERLLSTIEPEIDVPDREALGILPDANDKPGHRWNAVVERIRRARPDLEAGSSDLAVGPALHRRHSGTRSEVREEEDDASQGPRVARDEKDPRFHRLGDRTGRHADRWSAGRTIHGLASEVVRLTAVAQARSLDVHGPTRHVPTRQDIILESKTSCLPPHQVRDASVPAPNGP